METLQIFRGISIDQNQTDEVVNDIKSNGIYLTEKSQWSGFVWKNLKQDISTLLLKEDLKRTDTEPSFEWIKTKNGGYRNYTGGETGVCFADRIGAEYYALKHNKTQEKNVSIIITATINIEDMAVDGRDFLYTVLGNIDCTDKLKLQRQINKLKILFGKKIELYIEKILTHPNSERIAICDLAINDNDIIREHSNNTTIIGGRYGTIFKSAFFAKTPLNATQIDSVEILKKEYISLNTDITLNSILER